MIQNKFTQNLIRSFSKLITKQLKKKLNKYVLDYIEYNDCDELTFKNLTEIAEDINKYLNDKFADLFINISSAEFNDSYGYFEVFGVPLFQRFDDEKQFNLTPYDIIRIFEEPEFERFNDYLDELIWR